MSAPVPVGLVVAVGGIGCSFGTPACSGVGRPGRSGESGTPVGGAAETTVDTAINADAINKARAGLVGAGVTRVAPSIWVSPGKF